LDYKLAQKILQDRGHVVGSEYLKYLKKERLEMLAKPEPSKLNLSGQAILLPF
jgi:hypothetical protein